MEKRLEDDARNRGIHQRDQYIRQLEGRLQHQHQHQHQQHQPQLIPTPVVQSPPSSRENSRRDDHVRPATGSPSSLQSGVRRRPAPIPSSTTTTMTMPVTASTTPTPTSTTSTGSIAPDVDAQLRSFLNRPIPGREPSSQQTSTTTTAAPRQGDEIDQILDSLIADQQPHTHTPEHSEDMSIDNVGDLPEKSKEKGS